MQENKRVKYRCLMCGYEKIVKSFLRDGAACPECKGHFHPVGYAENARIYAVDFDGTLHSGQYPEIGEPKQKVIDYVKRLAADGHKLVLWTCREGEELEKAVEWCKSNEITFDGINENLPETIDSFGTDPRKIAAYRYIDDKAMSISEIPEPQQKGGDTVKNKYYSLVKNENEKSADIYIYGEITSWEFFDSDVSSYTLSKEIAGLDVDIINVYINSYGGEVAEGLAIYNQLKRHKATIKTFCDGFACSAASIIFMAGDERIMSSASLLMIHNVWTLAAGNANDLRKQADDLEKITQPAIDAYMERVNISEDELRQMLDNETWILPQEALDMEFATAITNYAMSGKASQNARQSIFKAVIGAYKSKTDPDSIPVPKPEPPAPKTNKLKNIFNAMK